MSLIVEQVNDSYCLLPVTQFEIFKIYANQNEINNF